ncbi:uncharacterized protein V6R79_002036 [Siganus canaliculatus]
MAWKSYTTAEALEMSFASREEENALSSDADSVLTEDEDHFFEGLDPYQDVVSGNVDAEQPSLPLPTDEKAEETEPAKGRGRGLSRQAAKRDSRSRGCGGWSRDQSTGGWKTEEEPDSLPQPVPRFHPKRVPGVQPPASSPASASSPMELFQLFF